jgi:transcription initiation factor TFIID subunit 7
MEEQFILRVPPSVAERIERLMNESAAASSSSSNPDDTSLDLSFSGQRRPRLSPSNPALLCAKTYRALG